MLNSSLLLFLPTKKFSLSQMLGKILKQKILSILTNAWKILHNNATNRWRASTIRFQFECVCDNAPTQWNANKNVLVNRIGVVVCVKILSLSASLTLKCLFHSPFSTILFISFFSMECSSTLLTEKIIVIVLFILALRKIKYFVLIC